MENKIVRGAKEALSYAKGEDVTHPKELIEAVGTAMQIIIRTSIERGVRANELDADEIDLLAIAAIDAHHRYLGAETRKEMNALYGNPPTNE